MTEENKVLFELGQMMAGYDNDGSSQEDFGIVALSSHLLKSPAFYDLFGRGMALVEEAANYLDTTGRAQSRMLAKEASLVYATESMRLTTRLMQLASWLLLQRAVSDGEMSAEQAKEEQEKVRLKRHDKLSRDGHWEHLPEELQGLIERSMRLQEQIIHFDEALTKADGEQNQDGNPLEGHFSLIREAFSK